MQFDVTTNIAAFKRGVNEAERDQIPFAVALALTHTAKGGQSFAVKMMKRLLDNPTRFTERGVAVKPATKRRLVAEVFVKDIQAAYLHWQAEGGTRYPARRAIPVPVGVRLNKFGNMPRRKLQQLLARKDTFSGTVKGVGGIWQRMRSGRVKLLVAYEPQARYRRRYPFTRIVEREVARRFNAEVAAAFEQAVNSAR